MRWQKSNLKCGMDGLPQAATNGTYRGKVSTVSTLLNINNLSVYTTPYIFSKVFTSLRAKDLSVYINVNVKSVEEFLLLGKKYYFLQSTLTWLD
jgi:hypothetical protein